MIIYDLPGSSGHRCSHGSYGRNLICMLQGDTHIECIKLYYNMQKNKQTNNCTTMYKVNCLFGMSS